MQTNGPWVCVCVYVYVTWLSVVLVTGTVQSKSAAVNSLLSSCAVADVCLFFEQTFAFHMHFLFWLSAFALITISLRPKKSDIFYRASFFFFFYTLLVVKYALWFSNRICFTLRKMWREHLEKAEKHSTNKLWRTPKAQTGFGQERDTQGARSRVQVS